MLAELGYKTREALLFTAKHLLYLWCGGIKY